MRRPEIRDAVFIASPSLDESIEAWRMDPESEREQRVERALVRYFARLSGRPTPFGLFAGCSVGTIGDETRLEVASQAEYRRHTRLDIDYLFALADALARDPALRRAFVLTRRFREPSLPPRMRQRPDDMDGPHWERDTVRRTNADLRRLA